MRGTQCTSRERIPILPCFSLDDPNASGCIRLPAAPACNIQCGFCSRTFDLGEELQGLSLTPEAAVEDVRSRIERGEPVSSVVVSGPGEPLANAATFVVLRQLNCLFPDLLLGISTNSLLLRDRLEQVVADGVRSIAITISSFWPETAKRVYSRILYKGRQYSLEDAAEFLLRNQWQGLMLAVDAGLHVTVNTVFLHGVNEGDIPLIAEKAGRYGARAIHILPAPGEGLKDGAMPDEKELAALREKCRPFFV